MKVRSIKAFTLLESLVALLILSGSVLILSALTHLFQSEIQKVRQDNGQDWNLFCTLLRSELSGAKFNKVENNYLYVTQKTALRFGQGTGDDFRKSNAEGKGYQPMIFGLKESKVSNVDDIVKITVAFDKGGGERTFIYKMEK